MVAMSVVVPLSDDVAGLLAVLAAVSVVAVLAAGSVAEVLAQGLWRGAGCGVCGGGAGGGVCGGSAGCGDCGGGASGGVCGGSAGFGVCGGVLAAGSVAVQVVVQVAVFSAVQRMVGALHDPAVAGATVPGDVVAEVLGWDLESLALGEGQEGRCREEVNVSQERFFRHTGTGRWRGLGVEVEVVVVGGVRLLNLGEGAWAGGCCKVDGCWVGVCLRLCTLGVGLTDTLVEDTGDV
ncbi:hypothetical protein NDU88_007842 [Pleurodeles waltl]|uniref:Uncharacterized protein n=1 Tax=Pleurodeles waltl TaxID=8319 RepID=A0AAV7RQK8_PLEWA|nr:hypothetical protein NDU88_007842 [Pleurodeles waltl]